VSYSTKVQKQKGRKTTETSAQIQIQGRKFDTKMKHMTL
jgi:hypothetical protein